MFFPGLHPPLRPGKNGLEGAERHPLPQADDCATRDRFPGTRLPKEGVVFDRDRSHSAAVTRLAWRGCAAGTIGVVCPDNGRAHDASIADALGGLGGRSVRRIGHGRPGQLGHRWSGSGAATEGGSGQQRAERPRQRAAARPGPDLADDPQPTEGDPYRQRPTRTDSAGGGRAKRPGPGCLHPRAIAHFCKRREKTANLREIRDLPSCGPEVLNTRARRSARPGQRRPRGAVGWELALFQAGGGVGGLGLPVATLAYQCPEREEPFPPYLVSLPARPPTT